ncbi:MAG: hypothetical protein H6760_04755 [Candidatus Nomurabacteria bacterium]|nr:MAG: hypothetical protein H6760_04755 [Candidatus Nomurabacteria bacterium]
MRIRVTVLVLMLFGFATLAQADARSDREKVWDLAFMKAKPWRTIQGQAGGDRSAQNLLITLSQGVTLEPEFQAELVQEWHQRNDRDLRDALAWCRGQWRQYPLDTEGSLYWDLRCRTLEAGDLCLSCTGRRLSFDDMRRWAYYWRYYGDRLVDPGMIEERNFHYQSTTMDGW